MQNPDLEQFLTRLKTIIGAARRFNTYSGIQVSFNELEKIRSDFSKQGYFREAEDVELILDFLRNEKIEREAWRHKNVDLTSKLSQELPIGRIIGFRTKFQGSMVGSIAGFLADRVIVKVGEKGDIYEVSPHDIKA